MAKLVLQRRGHIINGVLVFILNSILLRIVSSTSGFLDDTERPVLYLEGFLDWRWDG